MVGRISLLLASSCCLSALAQLQCPTVNQVVPESWLQQRSGPFDPSKAPPIPDYKTKRLRFVGSSLKTCREEGRPVETIPVGSGSSRVCVPDSRRQHYSYQFWAAKLAIAEQEAQEPAKFNGKSRLATSACLTCFAFARPAKAGSYYPAERKNSVLMAAQLACGRPLQDTAGQAFYGPRKSDSAGLRRLRESIDECRKTPSCADLQQRIATFNGAYKQFVHVDRDLDEVPAVKTRQEVPIGSAQVIQSEVVFHANQSIMTGFALPWGERCSAFEYGLVVLGPGEADAACWLTPNFDDPIAQAAFQDSVHDSEAAAVVKDTKARRKAAQTCRGRYAQEAAKVAQAESLARGGQTFRARQALGTVGGECPALCRMAKKVLPAGHAFLRQPQAFPDLCTRKFLALAGQVAALRRQI